MLASVLQEAGYKTGLYTSPHLRDFRERIRVDGEMIPKDSVVAFADKHRGIFEELKPSFFEMTVAMAFDYFAQKAVDVAVIEVGLGGRLDSTNIIRPLLSVITNIGHDHMDLLGNTPQKIAAEKAGIIKKSVPVVISETQPDVREVFISRASDSGSMISFADERFLCSLLGTDNLRGERGYTVTDLLTNDKFEGTTVLCGNYQSGNIQAVFCSILNLQAIFSVTDKNLSDGIMNVVRNTGLEGRWQILNAKPLTICDTAHNREGLEYVIQQIRMIPKTALHIILGFVNDKDLNLVLPLFPPEARYYFTKASVPRALNAELLKAEAAKYRLEGESYPDVNTALDKAKATAGESDLIFIGGSTFIVADVI
jgi:dihydrofolate synthase/folylpolyglutamate synthase